MASFLIPNLLTLLIILLSQNLSQAFLTPIYHKNHPILSKFNQQNTAGLTGVVSYERAYVVGISIGNELKYLVFDTGSPFTWVKSNGACKECTSTPQSSTKPYAYTGLNFTCTWVEECPTGVPSAKCIDGFCTYEISYLDTSSSYGRVVSDIIAPFKNETIQKSFIFGVGLINNCNPPDSCFQGIAGFGARGLSFAFQFQPQGRRWGFYLPIDERSEGFFMIGDDASFNISTQTTNMYEYGSVFVVDITSILIEEFNFSMKSTPNTLVVVDTGSEITYLVDSLYQNFMKGMIRTIRIKYDKDPMTTPSSSYFEHCYDGIYPMSVKFNLGNATIVIEDTIWYEQFTLLSTYYCLAFKSSGNGTGIIGGRHVRGYTVVYDTTNEPFLEIRKGVPQRKAPESNVVIRIVLGVVVFVIIVFMVIQAIRYLQREKEN